MESLFSHAKLILMGEYAVLHGSNAICLPLKTGQKLEIKNNIPGQIHWKWSFEKNILTDITLESESLEILETKAGNAQWAVDLILYIRQQNPVFLRDKGCSLHFVNFFPPQWGLGSSSATISSLCRFAGVNPYVVNEKLMGGSGADIACTTAPKWFLYRRSLPQPELWQIPTEFQFPENTFFIYSGQKQETAGHLKSMVQTNSKFNNALWSEVDKFILRFIAASALPEAFKIIDDHELLIASQIQKQPIGNLFKDFPGKVKSLGAWGGDFFMAMSQQPHEFVKNYFSKKGFDKVFLWKDFVNANAFSG
jgi:mevalonate kinase